MNDALQTVTLSREKWTTIMASLYHEAARVKLPKNMTSKDTDEWKIAEEIEQQLPDSPAFR